MMLSLFSTFDPYMGYMILNWLSSMIILMLIPQIYWFMKSRLVKFLMLLFMMLLSEFKVVVKNNFNGYNLILFISMFFFVMINNFMGLFSYIFVSTSHLVFSMYFSLSMWLGLMMFGWLKNYNFMFIHLVPMGTPFVLMFFMVLIETLSNIIRPMTLAIRLVANMIAGHLLLTLLSSFIPSVLVFMIILPVQLMLLILELAVSIIQAYVYVILMVLYLKETN